MAKKTTCIVYLPGNETARFSSRTMAINFARFISVPDNVLEPRETGYFVEVADGSGLIAQFNRGKATPEFAHLNRGRPA